MCLQVLGQFDLDSTVVNAVIDCTELVSDLQLKPFCDTSWLCHLLCPKDGIRSFAEIKLVVNCIQHRIFHHRRLKSEIRVHFM